MEYDSIQSPTILIDNEDNINILFTHYIDSHDSKSERCIEKYNNNGKVLEKTINIQKKYGVKEEYNYQIIKFDKYLNAYVFDFEEQPGDWRDGPNPFVRERIYFTKINRNGNMIFNKIEFPITIDNLSYPEAEYLSVNIEHLFIDSLFNIHVLTTYRIHTIEGEGRNERGVWNVNVHYTKIGTNGSLIIKDQRITNGNRVGKFKSLIDSENNIHILIMERHEPVQYIKLNQYGMVIKKSTSIKETSEIKIISIPITYDFDYTDNLTGCFVLDPSGTYLSFQDFATVDSNNNFHFVMGFGDSCGGEDAHILYSKYNNESQPIIENKTIVTHKRRSGFDHGPAVFDPQIVADNDNNLHLVWYINDGGNHFNAYYLKLSNDGNEKFKKIRILHNGNLSVCSYGILILLALLITVVCFLIYRKRRKMNTKRENQ